MPTLNLQYYKGPDAYSDGAIEDELLKLVEKPREFMAVLARDDRWPLLYHLSPERRNLLEWYPFRRDAALLEIGAGCGALTGLFAERVAQVTAVELSEKRSRIIERRYADIPNLEIMAGNFTDMVFDRSFDYVTLIGVLEYTRAFIQTPDPYGKLLSRIAAVLKPGGVLIVAVENRLGLKYFAGARDDHTGRQFDGIEGYPACITMRSIAGRPAGGGAETFARDELSQLLRAGGFTEQTFYYPYPDYKLPAEIFSDAFLPAANHMLTDAPNYDQERLKLFSEQRAWATIIRNGKFPQFANSFLVLAARGKAA
ncbi:MAG: class I SAM-dependent methyltransferase [Kiritimatiellae bacterium]|nr:class I SAM-dependent methyltransferase [Verrucomicrobiota bacterium]MBU4285976.1 class I SAM-dependent methyltransferase [Verrucomicrobiota bacterium]MBU4365783.1 class I SAM-dependent methyltransferase [Verrucomicrobiota bacterium]MCG2661807.1 class I SAM-dependent methyltransferase [Kiritimatiellia bacterium]